MHVYSKYMWLNMLIMLVGIVLFAVGTGLYAAADLGRGSYEAVTFALAEKNHWQVKKVRMILDAAMVVIGVILGGKFGVCTVVTVIVSGPIIQFTYPVAKDTGRWQAAKNFAPMPNVRVGLVVRTTEKSVTRGWEYY